MAREARGIYNAALAGGVNPAFVAGLAGAESGFGSAGFAVGRFNPYGFGVHNGQTFKNYTQATQAMVKALRDPKGYYRNARTLSQFINIYSPPSENDTNQHIANITSIGRKTGGDPTVVVIGAGRGAGVGAAPPPTSVPGVQSPAPRGSNSIDARRLGALLSQQYAATAAGDYDQDLMRRTSLEVANVVGQRLHSQAAGSTGGATAPVASSPAGGGQGGAGGAGGVSLPPLPRSGRQPKLSKWGGPEDHGSRALGNWQSDMAYDLGGPTGTLVTSPMAGTVVKISGQPGVYKTPQFSGYGITVDYGGGHQVFFKHLGSKGANIRPGAHIGAGTVIGGLDPTTNGGPHLHLGATSRSFLDQIMSYYTGG